MEFIGRIEFFRSRQFVVAKNTRLFVDNVLRMSVPKPQRQLVLVVEDDPATREVLCSVLEMSGMYVDWADSVRGAIQKLVHQPRFICLDLHLTDGVGTAVLQVVRQKKLPISVAVATATPDETLLAELAALKPDRLLRKPYDLEDIMSWLKEAGSKAA